MTRQTEYRGALVSIGLDLKVDAVELVIEKPNFFASARGLDLGVCFVRNLVAEKDAKIAQQTMNEIAP